MTHHPLSAETRLRHVQASIDAAEKAAGRDPGSVRLIVVSKTFAMDDIEPVLAAGHRRFGENRVQEAYAKWLPVRASMTDLELHLIGPLQSNKVADAVALFDVIHTVDRSKIAAGLAREMIRQNRRPRLLVQVNIGSEPQKAGVLPDEVEAFLAECRDVHDLTIDGLMCIPPHEDDPAPHFARLAEMAGRNELPMLSMGMSGDYVAAIACGATHVRVGSAIFGSRD